VTFAPLAGVRIVDVTTSIAGPYCAQILAALGADVVKVERPDTGDDARAWGPPFWAGESPMFLSANAGKRSLAVSLRDPRGLEVVLRLADRADVFLQSLRPGLAERLGLGATSLRERNERLVTCAVGSYGRSGPRREEPGYDALMQAAGGLVSVTGEPGRPGVRVGASLIDQGTGAWAAIGILAALLERERTGAGREVDVSLYETAVGYLGYHLAGFLADGTVPRGEGTRFPMVAPYQVLRVRGGELMVICRLPAGEARVSFTSWAPGLRSQEESSSRPSPSIPVQEARAAEREDRSSLIRESRLRWGNLLPLRQVRRRLSLEVHRPSHGVVLGSFDFELNDSRAGFGWGHGRAGTRGRAASGPVAVRGQHDVQRLPGHRFEGAAQLVFVRIPLHVG